MMFTGASSADWGAKFSLRLQQKIQAEYNQQWSSSIEYHPAMADIKLRRTIAPSSMSNILNSKGTKAFGKSDVDKLWLSEELAAIPSSQSNTDGIELALKILQQSSPSHFEEVMSVCPEIRIVTDDTYIYLFQKEAEYKSFRGLGHVTDLGDQPSTLYSYTDSQRFGCPFVADNVASHPVYAAILFAHECGHHYLHAVNSGEPLITNAGANILTPSPARLSQRPLEDSLHAVVAVEREIYVSQNILDMIDKYPNDWRDTITSADIQFLSKRLKENLQRLQASVEAFPSGFLSRLGNEIIREVRHVI